MRSSNSTSPAATSVALGVRVGSRKRGAFRKNLTSHPMLYAMALPVVAYYLIFHYAPMYGMVMAFQRFVPARGFFRSEWIGLQHFRAFFTDYYFFRLVRNTLVINVYQLVFGFPVPVIFALLLNELRRLPFKKTIQTITYMPHFISAVVVCGLVIEFTKSSGLITHFAVMLGARPGNLLARPELFRGIFVTQNIWQQFGWGSIIYVAALSGIDPALYEAATIDGANRWRQALHITLPGIAPTIIILLILRMGQMMSLGWEKIILLYSPLTYETADVISTYVYRRGLIQFDYSYAAAVGIFNSLINFALLVSANWISRRVNETSMW